MIQVKLRGEAEVELEEVVAWYEGQRIGLGARFFKAVKTAMLDIAEYPLSYREIEDGMRQCKVYKFPFALLYSIEDATLARVYAVVDLRREPGYWKGR